MDMNDTTLKPVKLYLTHTQDAWLNEVFPARERSRVVQMALDRLRKDIEAKADALKITRILSVEQLRGL